MQQQQKKNISFNLEDTNSSWSSCKTMHSKRTFFGVAILNDKVFVAGGRNSTDLKVTDSVECYDPKTDLWTTIANMKEPRATHGLVALNGCLYAVGGFSYSRIDSKYIRSKTIERYCPEIDEWIIVGFLPSNI